MELLIGIGELWFTLILLVQTSRRHNYQPFSFCESEEKSPLMEDRSPGVNVDGREIPKYSDLTCFGDLFIIEMRIIGFFMLDRSEVNFAICSLCL